MEGEQIANDEAPGATSPEGVAEPDNGPEGE
jgi:hypothetical protein